MKRTIFSDEHLMFRDAFTKFVEQEMEPHTERWDAAGVVDRALFTAAAKSGFLAMQAPEEFGGGGVQEFTFNAIISEVLWAKGLGGPGMGITLHNDITLPYFLHLTNDEQKKRWLPDICTGEKVTAIAMTEPGIGSDLASMGTTAIRDGDHYVVNGAKTFITNGINADLVVVACKTDPTQKHKGMSLIVLERGMPGFERGRNLDKVGLHAQDTAELFFTDVLVPVENRLGDEGAGFSMLVHNLPQERLAIAIAGVAAAQAALDWTVAYTKERKAFGQPLLSFQNTKFKLAEVATEVEIGQTFVDKCITDLNEGTLSAETAAMAKWWCTELQKRVVDTCLQLHGGYGYMMEYPIAKAYLDARVTTIYGGTTEIMKEIIGKNLLR